MSTDESNTPETIRALARDLLATTRLGEGPIRLDDWSMWTARQCWAYKQLRRRAGLPEDTPEE